MNLDKVGTMLHVSHTLASFACMQHVSLPSGRGRQEYPSATESLVQADHMRGHVDFALCLSDLSGHSSNPRACRMPPGNAGHALLVSHGDGVGQTVSRAYGPVLVYL